MSEAELKRKIKALILAHSKKKKNTTQKGGRMTHSLKVRRRASSKKVMVSVPRDVDTSSAIKRIMIAKARRNDPRSIAVQSALGVEGGMVRSRSRSRSMKSKKGASMKSKSKNPWLTHLKKYHTAHPNLTYTEAMSKARASYKKK